MSNLEYWYWRVCGNRRAQEFGEQRADRGTVGGSACGSGWPESRTGGCGPDRKAAREVTSGGVQHRVGGRIHEQGIPAFFLNDARQRWLVRLREQAANCCDEEQRPW